MNTQITGFTQGTGKTTTVIDNLALPDVLRNDCAVVFCDLDGSGAERFCGHVLERGHGRRLIVIDLAKPVITSFGMAFKSDHPDPFIRESENRMLARLMGDLFTGHRDESLDQTRIIKEWVMFAFEVWQWQDRITSPLEIRNALRPGTPAYDRLIEHCTYPQAHAKADKLKAVAKSVRLYDQIGAAERLIEEHFNEPLLREMMDPTADLEQALLRKAIIAVSGCEQEFLNLIAIRTLIERCSQIVHRHWLRERKPLLVRRYADECARIVNEQAAVWCGRNTKKGETTVWISQTANYGDEDVNELMEENNPLKLLFASISEKGAERNEHHLKLLLDPKKVKRVIETKKSVHDGFDEIDTQSFAERTIPATRDHTKKTLVDRRYGTTQRARFRDEVEKYEELESLTEQGMMHQVGSMQLGKGCCYIRCGNSITGPIYLPKLPTPFIYEGVARKHIDRHIENQLAAGISRRPKPHTCNQTQNRTDRAANGAMNQQNQTGNGKSKGKSGRRGMG